MFQNSTSYMFPRLVHTWEYTDDLHIRMYFKWFSLNQSLNKFYVTQSFYKQKQLAGSFKSFHSENSGKTSKKTSMTKENMVAIYDLGFSCKNSVQKDFKNKILKFFTCVTILTRNTFTKMMSYLHVPYYLQNSWS